MEHVFWFNGLNEVLYTVCAVRGTVDWAAYHFAYPVPDGIEDYDKFAGNMMELTARRGDKLLEAVARAWFPDWKGEYRG